MPERSFEKFVRKPDSDALLLPPIALTRFAKLCCNESTAELELVEVVPVPVPAVLPEAAAAPLPLTSEIRLCSAELSGPESRRCRCCYRAPCLTPVSAALQPGSG
jgi:hypothetical protein